MIVTVFLRLMTSVIASLMLYGMARRCQAKGKFKWIADLWVLVAGQPTTQ
jgi:hypothetical protein